ncbi:glutathione S-transferase [Dyella jiangningensis]|jgi:glutathione S-transferase|uniref:glutathione S-transferase family protein n=1 Tax=Dyella jiangningensis TaxID=1379159 RepID=UPI0004563B23|nr:glutathione S-transferase N-terminal domain-containing protein [Dyella jiangningensis]AHX15324.1 glutathione S-transferase [Dyella jiangningensis]MDG2539735.1 glutathione S-transferase N-terminal domain-containing protein [Dyella jiangningensis]
MTTPRVTFYHAPNSRSGGTRALLEELGVEYDMHVLNFKHNEQRQAPYTDVNPMGKVPAIWHNGGLVTEQPAVYLYLADLYPEKGLAPPIGDPLRGPYLRWMVFYGSSFEPALVDRAMKREPVQASTCPYGDWDTMFNTLVAQLERGPYMLGERFTALDVLWGSALRWTTLFKLVPELPVITAYIERIASRPAIQRATALDAELAAAQAA